MRKAGLLLLLLGTVALHGQIPYQQSSTPWPKNPTTNDDVTFVVWTEASCSFDITSSVNGYAITIDMVTQLGCGSALNNYHVPLGQLPAGTYTVTVNIFGDSRVTTFAVVDGTTIPTLSPTMLAVLLITLGGIGVVAMRATTAAP